MSGTTWVITITKQTKGEHHITKQKFDTEKKARKAYEKERQTLLQNKKLSYVFVDSACYFMAVDGTIIGATCTNSVSIKLSTEINFEYYVSKLLDPTTKRPDKVRKIVEAIYKKGYDKGWEEGHW